MHRRTFLASQAALASTALGALALRKATATVHDQSIEFVEQVINNLKSGTWWDAEGQLNKHLHIAYAFAALRIAHRQPRDVDEFSEGVYREISLSFRGGEGGNGNDGIRTPPPERENIMEFLSDTATVNGERLTLDRVYLGVMRIGLETHYGEFNEWLDDATGADRDSPLHWDFISAQAVFAIFHSFGRRESQGANIINFNPLCILSFLWPICNPPPDTRISN